jgi:hypothetical protein
MGCDPGSTSDADEPYNDGDGAEGDLPFPVRIARLQFLTLGPDRLGRRCAGEQAVHLLRLRGLACGGCLLMLMLKLRLLLLHVLVGDRGRSWGP